MIIVGTRNMQNFDLLKEVGRIDVPVTPGEFATLMGKLDVIARAIGRSVDRRAVAEEGVAA
jgi:3-deoxy-D-arabino-heptulosonate 7-phosphate (DAHP) synthase